MSYTNFESNSSIAGNCGFLLFKRTNNFAAVGSGDILGQIQSQGFDGVQFQTASFINISATGAPAVNIPSKIQFYSSTGTATHLAMSIGQDGQVTLTDPFVNQTTLVVNNNQSTPNINLRTANATATNAPHMHFTRSRAGTNDVLANDDLGRLEFFGFQGGTAREAAEIKSVAQTVNGTNGVSGYLSFSTVPSTYAAMAERMRISADGNVTISTPLSGTALTIVGGGETITAGNLTLSNGNINLTTTTSATTGAIFAGVNRFIHNYGTTNTFAGILAGNFTLTGTNNVAFGTSSGSSISSGTHNTAIGAQCLGAVNTGSFNTGLGQAYQSLTNGTNNIGIGYGAGLFITSGSQNIILGNYNTNGGQNYTSSESNNICIGNAGVTGQSNAIRIGISGAGTGQQDKCFIAGIDGVNVGSVAKVLTMASDQLGTATITAGSGISVTPTANTITIATTNGIAWTEVTGTTQAMAVDNGYISSNAGLVTLTLPATAVVGDRIRIAGKGAGGWRCAQNAGQTINFGNTATTAGVAGYIDSTNQYDALELLCITANTTWVALSSVGNLNVV